MPAPGVRRRPSLWSYFSFGPTSSRRQSVSLPTRNAPHDPFEKPDRHTNGVLLASGAMDGNGSSSRSGNWWAQFARSRLFRVAGVASVLLILLYFLAPSDNRVTRYVERGSRGGGQTASDPSLGTTKCQRSSDPSKPLVQYALMIDAGSTGSRIHVYRFNNCGPTPELESEIFEQTEKRPGGSGLSSYKADAEGAAKSLDPLLKVALKHVPDKLKACTPIAVKATAGLRMLGDELSRRILDAVRRRLETAYPFAVVAPEHHGVEIMDGKDEGVYAWITTNYLLGKIGGPSANRPTAAVLDLGGGSTQIVFEPAFKVPEHLLDGEHKYLLTFGGRRFTLYQHSHLGYGLMAAREAIHKAVVEALYAEHGGDKTPADTHRAGWLAQDVPNPCLAPGMHRKVEVKLGAGHALGESVTVNMTGPTVNDGGSNTDSKNGGSGGTPAQCRGLAEKILRKDAACALAPCSFGGVHQPSLEQTFAHEDVYAFSYFYDRLAPLGMPASFTLRELHDVTARVCAGDTAAGAWRAAWGGVAGALAELRGRPEYCLDLSYMLALLRTGYELPLERELRIAKRIKGNELGWCLGASLPLLNQQSGGWQCRIEEIRS